MIRRSQDEIVARITATEGNDFLGVIRSDLLDGLDFDHAKKYLKPEVTAAEWEAARAQAKPPLDQASDYMEFAWDKANNCRGISAGRSIQHFESWLWMAGADGFDAVSEGEYRCYGKPLLVIAATALGLDWRALDDGLWVDFEGGANKKPGDAEIQRLESIGTALREELEGATVQ